MIKNGALGITNTLGKAKGLKKEGIFWQSKMY
jgi:hypothetical protein